MRSRRMRLQLVKQNFKSAALPPQQKTMFLAKAIAVPIFHVSMLLRSMTMTALSSVATKQAMEELQQRKIHLLDASQWDGETTQKKPDERTKEGQEKN